MNRTALLTLLFLYIHGLSYGQLYMGSESTLTGNGTIATNAAIIDSSMIDTKLGTLSFEGNDTIYIHSQWRLDTFKVVGSPILAGSGMMVHQNLRISGTITPTSQMHLVIDTLASVSNSGESFINGRLFHAGSGDKFFPIGKGSHYAPTRLFGLENSSNEWVGLEAFNNAIGLSELPVSVEKVSENWYWQVSENPGNGLVQLPLLNKDIEDLGINEQLIIVQVDESKTTPTNIEGVLNSENDLVTSLKPISSGYLVLGIRGDVLQLDNKSAEVHVFPNPFTDHLTVETHETPQAITIYDLKGKIHFQSTGAENLMIDTSKWASGTYLMVIAATQKTVYRKLIKTSR